MYEKTFEEYKEWVHEMAKSNIPDAILDMGLSDRELMSMFVYEQLWNALQCDYLVPIRSLKSIDKEILKDNDIIVEGGKVTYKMSNTGEWRSYRLVKCEVTDSVMLFQQTGESETHVYGRNERTPVVITKGKYKELDC